ncbi:MAG: class I SAM-dependent methyltransferase [bacterium]
MKETYEKVALEFSQTRQKPWEEMNDLAREVFEGAKVLDIGCGNGRLLYSLPSNIRYLGVDICKGLIEEARKRHPDKRFIVGDFLSLPYNRLGGDYDFIFAIAVFHHLPTKRTRLNFLSKARKLLNKRGKLMLTVWNLWGEDKHKDKIDEDGDIFVPFGKEKAPRYYHAFKIEEMKNLAREARLEIERIKSNRNLVFVLKRYD